MRYRGHRGDGAIRPPAEKYSAIQRMPNMLHRLVRLRLYFENWRSLCVVHLSGKLKHGQSWPTDSGQRSGGACVRC